MAERISVVTTAPPAITWSGVNAKTEEAWSERFVFAQAVPQTAMAFVESSIGVSAAGTRVFNLEWMRALVEACLLDGDDKQRFLDMVADPLRQVPAQQFADDVTWLVRELMQFPFGVSAESPRSPDPGRPSDGTAAPVTPTPTV